MSDVSRIADSAFFKIVMPVLQSVLAAGVIGAFTYVSSAITSLQTQVAAYQMNLALLTQRVDNLERSRDALDKMVDNIRQDTQRHEFQINQANENMKALVYRSKPQ